MLQLRNQRYCISAKFRERFTPSVVATIQIEGSIMQKIILGALLLFSTAASAATDGAKPSIPLAPGKPAGIKAAQMWEDNAPLIVMGAAAVGIGIALAVSNDNNDSSTPPVTNPPTTGTSP
jgi:hypothetical protein